MKHSCVCVCTPDEELGKEDEQEEEEEEASGGDKFIYRRTHTRMYASLVIC